MKLKNRIMPAMLFFGVVAFSSCDDREKDTLQPTFEQGAISHVMVDSSEVTSYNYAGKSLTQINYYDKETGDLESFEKFIRDSKGNVIKSSSHAGANHAMLSEQDYKYNNKNQLTQTTTSYYNGSKLEYNAVTTFAYNSKKELEKKTVYEGKDVASAELKSYTTYEVLPNGNFGQEKQYVVDSKGTGKLFSTTTYSYDSNQNPFFAHGEPGAAASPNNMTVASTLVHASKKSYRYTYTYKYDERGYPTSQTVTSPNGQAQTFSYLYSN
ncbi:hypothetical protein JAO76_01270 [Pontibacter sp. BT310]|uniref:DUF4595 domain-containing protein n=1 Tax=Pontibacter populi TaxID=890055 RepID=A0ABS6X7N8_9BACT|nr:MULTISPECIES: hypothetical protein [Pontibacter]MBJ6116801.1 hypothetical protein [Pontibacter sp. BT310]MBR0569223.1 hypothetical protein [Microvirga sp. STS03]MBW3363654.1 hypothetical protein [Pontibacter populi]